MEQLLLAIVQVAGVPAAILFLVAHSWWTARKKEGSGPSSPPADPACKMSDLHQQVLLMQIERRIEEAVRDALRDKK